MRTTQEVYVPCSHVAQRQRLGALCLITTSVNVGACVKPLSADVFSRLPAMALDGLASLSLMSLYLRADRVASVWGSQFIAYSFVLTHQPPPEVLLFSRGSFAAYYDITACT